MMNKHHIVHNQFIDSLATFFNVSYMCPYIKCFWKYLQSISSGPFYSHGLTLITVGTSNYMPSKVSDEITYPFLNFNGATSEVGELVNNFILHFTMDVITYPCWYYSYTMLVKEATGVHKAPD